VARSIGEWRQKENKAAVTKITGSTLTGYGFQNKNGKFLNSEEATFFLETVTHLFLG
jgi:Na+-transporting NADH:ubiquinone oxidoreductase subunit NqrC